MSLSGLILEVKAMGRSVEEPLYHIWEIRSPSPGTTTEIMNLLSAGPLQISATASNEGSVFLKLHQKSAEFAFPPPSSDARPVALPDPRAATAQGRGRRSRRNGADRKRSPNS